MQCLWITLADPEPATNGQLIYSQGLIEAARQAGASLHVIGLARQEKPPRCSDSSGIVWQLGEERPMPKWRRLLCPLPQAARRGYTPAQQRAVEDALAGRPWDAVIFDSICAGWALDIALRHQHRGKRRPTLVYLAHNHEQTVARRIADDARGARRILKEIDALKINRLERRLIAHADIVTSNTPDDCRTFAAEAAGTPVVFLPPGYGGKRVTSRHIDATVPRRAVVIGSFNWPPKRISLERFLDEAVSVLAGAGVELQIVGETDPAYLDGMRSRFPSVAFVGRVDDVDEYMAAARVALVPDQLGGFKLKGLDYVFNRMPILAMKIALPGMPLEEGRNISLFDSHRALAKGVVALIDDFPALNARQESAFAACSNRFDWARIGQHLLARIARATCSPADAPAGPAIVVST